MIEQDDPDPVELVDMPCPVCKRVYPMPADIRKHIGEYEMCCGVECRGAYDDWLDEQRRSADLAMPPVTEHGGES